MNYTAHYDRLIERARARVLVGYKERHHVVPKCMGGGNEPSNIVALTAEEHYVAHQLLVKLHPHNGRLAHAAALMAKRASGNKAYGWIRKRHGMAVGDSLRGKKKSPEHAANAAAAQRGRKPSLETRAKLAAAQLGKKLSIEVRAKMSQSLMGRKQSVAHVANNVAARIGARRSVEARARMSAAQVSKKRSPEAIAKAASQ